MVKMVLGFVIGLVVLSACSDDDGDQPAAPLATEGPETADHVDADTSSPDRPATTTTGSTPDSPSADESLVDIDEAFRAENGSVVVTVTAYRWGAGACLGQYFPSGSISASGELTVAVTEAIDDSVQPGVCAELGFVHALTVPGARDYAGTDLIDAATGDALAISTTFDEVRPSWFVERDALPDCGIDAEYTDTYPNLAARDCFHSAYDRDEPAEIARVTFGDEGESALKYFRVVGEGRYEVLEEQRPRSNGERYGLPWAWMRHECESFHFLDEPGYEVDNVPVLNWDGECAVVFNSQ